MRRRTVAVVAALFYAGSVGWALLALAVGSGTLRLIAATSLQFGNLAAALVVGMTLAERQRRSTDGDH